ncbi:hypothetical protein KLSP111695_04575 [Klebsiella spallanzanii]
MWQGKMEWLLKVALRKLILVILELNMENVLMEN